MFKADLPLICKYCNSADIKQNVEPRLGFVLFCNICSSNTGWQESLEKAEEVWNSGQQRLGVTFD